MSTTVDEAIVVQDLATVQGRRIAILLAVIRGAARLGPVARASGLSEAQANRGLRWLKRNLLIGHDDRGWYAHARGRDEAAMVRALCDRGMS